MEVAAVLHSIPGRIRVRVPSLRNNEAAAALLQARLGVLPAVHRVEANVATGTLVLHHDPDAHAAMEEALEDLLPSLESTAAATGGNGVAEDEPRPESRPATAHAEESEADVEGPGWGAVLGWVSEMAAQPGGLRRLVPLTFGAVGAADLLRRVVTRKPVPMPTWYTLLWYSYATWGLLGKAGAAGDSGYGEFDADAAPAPAPAPTPDPGPVEGA